MRNKFLIHIFFFFFLFFDLYAQEKVLIQLENKQEFIVDLASTAQEKRKGLMNIKKLKNTNGMLFLNKKARVVNMWMRDTHFDLAIIFININNRILDIKKGVKSSEKIISSVKPVIATLEIPSFCRKKLKLKIGDVIEWKFLNYKDLEVMKNKKRKNSFPCVEQENQN